MKRNGITALTLLTMSIALTGCMTTSAARAAAEQQVAIITQQTQQLDMLSEQQQQIQSVIVATDKSLTAQQAKLRKLNRRITKLNEQVLTTAAKAHEEQPDIDNSLVINKTEKPIIGVEEWVQLADIPEVLNARIDTGAVTSSLNAMNIIEFERDGVKWVRFDLHSNTTAHKFTLESKLLRSILIRQVDTAEPVRRRIVALPIKLGEITQLSEFTLADRSHMAFPVLLGRTFLKDIAIVDVTKTHTANAVKANNG